MMPTASDALASARQRPPATAPPGGGPSAGSVDGSGGAVVTAAEGASVPEDRVVVAGKVNFTIMYAAHDAFTRDLRRLRNACTTGRAFTPHTAATWARFKTQLQIHHRAEDARYPASSAAAYRAVPGAGVELLQGVGRTPMLEDPQMTGTLLLDFAAAAAHRS
jgi:hypothetical protein